MLNLKALFIGLGVQIITFLLIAISVVAVAVRVGAIQSDNYILFLEFASFFSVAVSSFICSRIAWSKAFLYGIIMSSFCLILRILICVYFKVPIDVSALAVKAGIFYSLGFCSAVLGVSIAPKEKF